MTPEAKTLNAIPVEDIGTVVIDSESIERFIEAAANKGYQISIAYARVGDTEHAQIQIAPIPGGLTNGNNRRNS
jgi:hypothetical protein